MLGFRLDFEFGLRLTLELELVLDFGLGLGLQLGLGFLHNVTRAWYEMKNGMERKFRY